MKKIIATSSIFLYSLFITTTPILAATTGEASSGGHGEFGHLFLLIAILLLAAKIGGIVEKFGQPSVLGELFAGILLSLAGFLGLGLVDEMRHNEILAFLAEVGAVILLFQIGLESNIKSLMKVGVNAFWVAIIGVIAPMALGTFVIGPLFFAEAPFITHLFIGASMVATSVGITASVFKGLGILKTRACQTVLGAAVIDDVLGLLVLAIVSALAGGQELTAQGVSVLAFQAFAFLAVALIFGNIFAKPVSNLFSKIHTGTGMKLGIAFVFALIYAYAATLVGLAPIIGAFAAGLILDAVYFDMFDSPAVVSKLKQIAKTDNSLKEIIHEQQHAHVEDMVSSLGLIFVPLFFAFTGLQIEIASLLNPQVYIIAVIASILAIISKLIGGIAVKGSLTEKALVGMSMVPRGEVGLIFAATGKALGAISDDVFSVIILVVIITTMVAPTTITMLSKKLTESKTKTIATKSSALAN